MAISKIILNGVTQMDVTQDTVVASKLLSGYTAHGADGESVTGEYIEITPTFQSKTITPTESQQIVEPDANYDGLSSVTVNAISDTYVGSAIDTRSGSDLTVSGATVTAQAGYYASAASKSVESGSAATPATTITANPTISVSATGLITATASASQNVTPTVSAGYVSSGTAGTITISGSGTQQLTTKVAATITPGTDDQTIAAETYLTGVQTIVGDANLIGSNIISTANIFGVQGTVVIQHVYSGNTDPSSGVGVNGDIYVKVVS